VPEAASKDRNCVQPGGPNRSLRELRSFRLAGAWMAPVLSTDSAAGPLDPVVSPPDGFEALGVSVTGAVATEPGIGAGTSAADDLLSSAREGSGPIVGARAA
jgi:hypothetical protein